MTLKKYTALVIGGSGSAGRRRVRLISERKGWGARTLDPNGGDYVNGETVPFNEFNAMFICSPPVNHAPWVEELSELKPRQHIFVEKPFCLPGEVRDMRGRYEFQASRMMVGHNLLWHKGFQKFKKESKSVGKMTLYTARFGNLLTNWLRDNPDAYSRHREQGGGVLLDCLQDIDVALDITGGLEPKAFHQTLGHSDITSNSEHTAVVLAFQGIDGPIATMAFDYYREVRLRLHEVTGEEGTALWQEDDREAIEDSYKEETSAFLKWVEGGKRPNRPDPFRALEFVRKVYAL